MQTTTADRWVKLSEAARRLGMGRVTLSKALASGRLTLTTRKHPGGYRAFLLSDVERALQRSIIAGAGSVACPLCGGPADATPLPGGEAGSKVRGRCEPCSLSFEIVQHARPAETSI